MRDDPVGIALRLMDDARDLAEARAIGGPVQPDVTPAGVATRAVASRAWAARFDALDRTLLPDAVNLTLAVVEQRLHCWTAEDDWYWCVFDPTGGELYGMFAPTAYCGGHAIAARSSTLRRMALETEGARHRYLAALHDLTALVYAFAERTSGQAAKGIRMPRPQTEQALALIPRIAGEQRAALAVGDTRLNGHGSFKAEVEHVLSKHLTAAFDAFAAVIDPSYLKAAPTTVGLSSLPGGTEIYRALCRHYSSSDLSPEEIHAIGRERVAEVRRGMAEARRDARFEGDDHAYRAHLDADPAWRVREPGELQAFFKRYIDRFAPHVDRLFGTRPQAQYGVRPLPSAMEEAMTFGYYEPAAASGGCGTYVYNARNLARGGLCNLGALTYHELVPGHHLHLALQAENLALPRLRATSLPTAFTEGWAEYAATLAGEVGMYDDPAERFGRLVAEAFLTSRLVVDTGMNALGWSLEEARAYLRENSFIGEPDILTETLRYACDIPGQALGYKLGDRALLRMRDAVAVRQGEEFDIRRFHDTVLGMGALPLKELENVVERLFNAQF